MSQHRCFSATAFTEGLCNGSAAPGHVPQTWPRGHCLGTKPLNTCQCVLLMAWDSWAWRVSNAKTTCSNTLNTTERHSVCDEQNYRKICIMNSQPGASCESYSSCMQWWNLTGMWFWAEESLFMIQLSMAFCAVIKSNFTCEQYCYQENSCCVLFIKKQEDGQNKVS